MSGFMHRHYLCGMDEHGFDCSSERCEKELGSQENKYPILLEQVKNIVGSLNPQEQKILEMRFGLVDNISHTLEDVEKELGVTRERIRQIEAMAIEKVRKMLEVDRWYYCL